MFSFGVDGDPYGLEQVCGCGGTQNFMGYCSPAATQLLSGSNQALTPSYREYLVNRAEFNLAGGVPALPLFQRPQLLAYRDELHGVVANAGPARATWNAEDWYVDP
jgi:ABC-type oligopeptide transport system substrate-binding subunit